MMKLLPIRVMAGDKQGDRETPGQDDASRAGVEIQLVEPVAGDYSQDIEVQPDRNPHLFDESDGTETDPDMAGQRIFGGRKEEYVGVVQFGMHQTGMPSDAADVRKEIVRDDPRSNDAPQ